MSDIPPADRAAAADFFAKEAAMGEAYARQLLIPSQLAAHEALVKTATAMEEYDKGAQARLDAAELLAKVELAGAIFVKRLDLAANDLNKLYDIASVSAALANFIVNSCKTIK